MSDYAEFSASLYPCPLCEAPMILGDTPSPYTTTFWARDAVAYATPHKDGCRLQGDAVPEGLDLIGLLREEGIMADRWGVPPYKEETD